MMLPAWRYIGGQRRDQPARRARRGALARVPAGPPRGAVPQGPGPGDARVGPHPLLPRHAAGRSRRRRRAAAGAARVRRRRTRGRLPRARAARRRRAGRRRAGGRPARGGHARDRSTSAPSGRRCGAARTPTTCTRTCKAKRRRELQRQRRGLEAQLGPDQREQPRRRPAGDRVVPGPRDQRLEGRRGHRARRRRAPAVLRRAVPDAGRRLAAAAPRPRSRRSRGGDEVQHPRRRLRLLLQDRPRRGARPLLARGSARARECRHLPQDSERVVDRLVRVGAQSDDQPAVA